MVGAWAKTMRGRGGLERRASFKRKGWGWGGGSAEGTVTFLIQVPPLFLDQCPVMVLMEGWSIIKRGTFIGNITVPWAAGGGAGGGS